MSLFGKAKVEKTDIEKRFNLIGRVGQGSMSKVWRAEDKMSGSFVAVKVLDKEKTRRFEERFKGLNKPTEADIAFALKHPYIVKTLEVGQTLEDEMYLVMDYVEGSGLSLLVDLQSEDMRRYRTRYMIQIGEALIYFHKENWIHRDICPRNIMVTDDHKIRLIDFGLAVPNTPDFCKPGNRTGTANYMAPELIKRRPTDHRIDVFAYAVTCYEMYAKRHPWDAAQTLDAVMQHINQPPVPLLELVPNADRQVAETIMKGLAMDPDDRWQTVSDMVTEFRAAEVRLVKATKELLAKRKQRTNGSTAPGAAVPSGAEPTKPKSKPKNRKASEKQDKSAAAAEAKRPAKKDAKFDDDSAMDILSPNDSTIPEPKTSSGASSKQPESSVPDDDDPFWSTDDDSDPLKTSPPRKSGKKPATKADGGSKALDDTSLFSDDPNQSPSAPAEASDSDDDILALPED